MNLRKDLSIAAAAFAVPAPLIIMGHEGSHYLVARWLGYFPHFSYNQNEFTGGESFSRDQPWICASAPIFHLTLGIAGAFLLWRICDVRRRALVAWIATVLCLAGCYHLVHLVGFIISPGKTGHMDEHKVAVALGWPAWNLHFFLWPLALCFLAWALRLHWRERTLLPLFVGFTAGVASLVCYFFVWGPLLLPHRTTSFPSNTSHP